jgi:hypothetical protein
LPAKLPVPARKKLFAKRWGISRRHDLNLGKTMNRYFYAIVFVLGYALRIWSPNQVDVVLVAAGHSADVDEWSLGLVEERPNVIVQRRTIGEVLAVRTNETACAVLLGLEALNVFHPEVAKRFGLDEANIDADFLAHVMSLGAEDWNKISIQKNIQKRVFTHERCKPQLWHGTNKNYIHRFAGAVAQRDVIRLGKPRTPYTWRPNVPRHTRPPSLFFRPRLAQAIRSNLCPVWSYAPAPNHWPHDNRMGCGRTTTRGVLADLLLPCASQGGRRGPGADSS